MPDVRGSCVVVTGLIRKEIETGIRDVIEILEPVTDLTRSKTETGFRDVIEILDLD